MISNRWSVGGAVLLVALMLALVYLPDGTPNKEMMAILALFVPLGVFGVTVGWVIYFNRSANKHRSIEETMQLLRPSGGSTKPFANGRIKRWFRADGKFALTEIILGSSARVVVFEDPGGAFFSAIHVYTSGDAPALKIRLLMKDVRLSYEFFLGNESLGEGWGPNLDLWLGYVLLGVPLSASEANSAVPPKVIAAIQAVLPKK